jgi:hypothetical protein
MAWNVPRNPYMKNILVLLVTLVINQVASAQLVSIGAKAGIPFVDQNQGGEESRRYIVGPSVEVRLPAGFAIEVDALYRRIGNSHSFSFPDNVTPPALPWPTFYIDRERGNYWEFPVLGKYYFRPRTTAWQPFFGTGWALRTAGFHDDISQTVIDANGSSHSSSFSLQSRSDLGVGAVFAAGVRLRVGRLAVLPEVRYTYWGSSIGSDLRRNEAGVLLGVAF